MKQDRLMNAVLLVESDAIITPTFSSDFLKDLTQAIDVALGRDRIINVPLLAEQVRRRNERENIAREDVEAKVLQLAQMRCAIMEFETTPMDLDTPSLPM
jgi:hypothetical protein